MPHSTESCHARKREHPGYQDTIRLAALRRSARRLMSALRKCPHGWIPAYAGMTRVGLVSREAARRPADSLGLPTLISSFFGERCVIDFSSSVHSLPSDKLPF